MCNNDHPGGVSCMSVVAVVAQASDAGGMTCTASLPDVMIL